MHVLCGTKVVQKLNEETFADHSGDNFLILATLRLKSPILSYQLQAQLKIRIPYKKNYYHRHEQATT